MKTRIKYLVTICALISNEVITIPAIRVENRRMTENKMLLVAFVIGANLIAEKFRSIQADIATERDTNSGEQLFNILCTLMLRSEFTL